jgi:hypothetical protein
MSATVCAAWGPLSAGRFTHMECPVVVHRAHEAAPGAPGRTEPLPLVCSCECSSCKRAWWNAGRPKIQDGAIVTDRGDQE